MALRSLHIKGGRYSAYFRWQEGAFTLLRAKDGEVGKDVQRRAYAVQKRMKRLAGKNTGELRRKIVVESTRETPDGPISKVISGAQHTLVHEYGRKAIKPDPARAQETYREGEYPPALRFRPKLGMGVIYRFEVAKAEGTHFMENSVDAALD